VEPAPAPPADPAVPTQKEILDAFTAATDAAPENPAHWQSLGDALRAEAAGNDEGDAAAAADRAKQAYREALRLQPPRKVATGLWYLLFEMEAPRAVGADSVRGPNAETALGYLRNAVEADPGNAFGPYLFAAFGFRAARFSDVLNAAARAAGGEKPDDEFAQVLAGAGERAVGRNAVAWIERGNRAPRFEAPRYRPMVPPLLRVAWGYQGDFDHLSFAHFAPLRELARAAGGYALVLAAEDGTKSLADADRACRAVVAMGEKLLADWPAEDRTRGGGEVITSLVGAAVAAIGQNALVKVYQQVGDVARAERAQAALDALKERSRARSRAVLSDDRSIYDDY
jgi:hypothetical protein